MGDMVIRPQLGLEPGVEALSDSTAAQLQQTWAPTAGCFFNQAPTEAMQQKINKVTWTWIGLEASPTNSTAAARLQ